MTSVQRLFENIQNPITVVWGNLGRRTFLLPYYLNMYPYETTVHISCDLWDKTGMHESFEDDGTHCDILIWLEPNFGETITKPHYADSMIVLTSHLNLRIPKKDCSLVAYQEGDPYRSHELVKKFKCYMDYVPNDDNIVILQPEPFQQIGLYLANIGKDNSYVVVDLTHCQSAREIYLCLLNVLEYMYRNISQWSIALSRGKQGSLELNLNVCQKILKKEYPKIPSNVDGLGVLEKIYFFQNELCHI